MWGLTLTCAFMGLSRFVTKTEENVKEKEVYARLLSIFSKNKYGYHTRFMSDFDLFLEAILNERFLDDANSYYDDPFVEKEIADQEAGLAHDQGDSDLRHLLHDKDGGHHDSFVSWQYPDRVANNYEKGDQLSCYKILPKKH